MNSEFHIGDVVRVTKYGHIIYGQLPIGLQGYSTILRRISRRRCQCQFRNV